MYLAWTALLVLVIVVILVRAVRAEGRLPRDEQPPAGPGRPYDWQADPSLDL